MGLASGGQIANLVNQLQTSCSADFSRQRHQPAGWALLRDLQLVDGVSSVPEPSSRLMSLTALLLASWFWLRPRPSH